MICPNYKIKEVFDGFNEVIEALGGKPMTEEEFRSSELRNLRTGRDYSAMEAAYKMYHRNNGNMPDVAPNGEHSILFDSLLEHFNGDRAKAIKAKANVYTDEFNSIQKEDIDENGEPFLYLVIKAPTIKISENMMAHLLYQSPSERTNKTNIEENKARVAAYYRSDSSLLRTVELSLQKLKLEALRLLGNTIYKDDYNSDTEENKNSAINKKIKEVNKLLGNAGYAYSFRLKGKGAGSMKISIKMKSALLVLDEEINTFVNGMSPEDLYRECMDIELRENEDMFHINPRKIPQLREQILKKSFLHKDDPDLVDRTIEFLKSLPNTQDDNALVECIIKWVKNDTIDAYRDFDKIKGLFTIARKHGMDVQRFKSPFELLDAVLHLENKEDAKPITNFNKYKHIHFSNTEIINGVEVQVYDVDNTEDGQKDVCQMLADSNPKVNGKALDFSPWCLSTFTIRNGVAVPSPSAQRFWNTYDRGNRQIAVVNGFPIAFNSSSNPGDFWWDYYDSPASTGKLLDLNFTSREEILKQKIESEGSALYYTFGPYRVDDTEIVFNTWELSVLLYKPTNHIAIFTNGIKLLWYGITENGLVDGDFEYCVALYIASKLNARTQSVRTLLRTDRDFYNDLEDIIIKLKNLKIESVPFDLKSIKSIADEFLLLCDELANKMKDEDIYFKQPKEIPTPQLSDLEYMTLEEIEAFFPDNPGTQDPVMIDRLSAEQAAREIIEDDYLWRQYEKYLAQPVRDRLQAKLHAILRKYHFEIIEDDLQEIFGQDVLGMFDYLNKVVYLSNTGNANAISDAEEFSHAFIKMMGSSYHLKLNRRKYPHGALYSKLRDLLVQTDFYKHVYEEYKDVYTFADGTPNLPKIKEEAMGKALAAILNDRWEVYHEANKSFFNALKSWFNNMLKWVKHLLTKHNAKAVDNLQYELEKIADSIIDGSYAKKYLDTVDKSKTRQVSLHESFLKSIDEDGGVAIRILLTLQQLGGVVSGSMSYRNQTPVFRKNADALHDLDVAFPLNMHRLHDMFLQNPRNYPSLYYVGPNNYFNQSTLEAAFSVNLAVSNIFNTMRELYPGFQIMYAYPASGNVVVNCIICLDLELVDRFKSLEGSFDSRLSHFTKEERSKIRLIDMFFNKDSSVAEDYVTEDEYGLNMANYKHSFREKLKYGRAKDLFDYLNLDPINRKIYSRERPVVVSNQSLMAHIGTGSTTTPDKVRKSAEDIRHRFGVLYKTYEKMPNKSPRRQQLANEIFEVYGEIKRLDNFDAVTKAMDFAEEKLGTKDGATNGVLQWLERNEADNFAKVSAEQIVDVMQNSIGFFEDLLTYFPSDSFMSDEAQEQRNRISGKIQHTLKPLWSKAVYAISDRIVDELVDRWFTGLDEDKEGMKEVAKDWLHKNAMYGDINSMAAFVQNYQYSKNPITKLVFHLIQVADTKTGMELHPISAKISKAYAKANKDFGKLNPAWLKIFMEFDKDGIPTGNFVRDINYGQYQKDIDEFITNLNSEFLKKYGHSYYIDEDGTYINTLTGGFADDEEWVGNTPPHIIEYKLKIEEFKCKRANRRYTFEYYKERMSEPYDGPDPALTNLTGNFKHGLSPRTLSKYNRILSNINYYMSLCYDKETGVSHPENLSDSDWAKLESFRKELETLSNPYNEDGTVKSGEDYKTAIEIRAWEKWIGEKLDTQVDIDQFEREAQEILSTKGPIAYDRFIKYNSKIGINPNLISQTLKMFGASDAYAEAIHARLLKSSLQRLVSTKDGYTRDLSVQENNPLFWQECKKTDQLIEDYGVSRGKDFALMMENTFSNDLIKYRDTYGNAYDLNGNIVPRDKEKDTQLMTWYDHMINEYTSKIIASPSRTIEGLYDRSTGALYVFSGNNNDVRSQVESLFTYRRVRHNSDGTSSIVREPLTIFSLLTPLHDTFINHKTGKTEKSITNIPSGRFSTKTDKMRMYLTDPSEYDYNSHISEQPKREYYDNTEAFEKVKGSAKDLYDVLIEVCTNTQLLYKQSGSPFNYRLPMINAQSMALLSRLKSDGYKNVSRAIWDAITTIEENDENMRTSSLFATNPDGTVATDIPLKFVRPLKDMRRLSTDISSMVVLFAEMGLNYKNKLKIDSSVKALRYNMDPAVRNMLERLFDDKIPSGDNEHSVDLFDNMTNIHLYGNDWHFKKKSADTYNGAIIAGQKIARFVQRYETTHMLGLNILSMLVGACDAGVKQLREVINGKYARPEDLVKGLVRCIIHTPAAIANIGCPLANNKFTALMLLFRISKGTRATYEHMNWSRIKKVAAQFLMGGFSMLDYMMNGLLLMSHMSNVRLYNEDGHDSEIPTGFYTLYELQQQFVKVGRKKSLATLTHLFLKTDLYNAFDFNSEEGVCYVKDKYKNYVTDDIATQIRTKTLSRGALYNGMNPDNDQPKARKKVWSSMVLAMRGWLTQAYQHLVSGGTDNIPVVKKANSELLTRYGVTRLIPSIGREAMTNEQRARRQSWNYETGTPLDLIMVGIARSFGTMWRYLITNAFRNIPEGDPKKVKFSYVEKYAWKDALIYFAVLGFMLGTFPLVNNAAGELPPPDESDPKLLDDPYAYIVDVYIPNEYWKLQLADIYFRTIESSISSVDPTTAVDFITSLSVLKSGFDEQWGLILAGADYMGLSDHSLDEIVNRGGYRYYSRGMRAFAKGLGFLDNIHTAFDFYGLDSNLLFYLGKYGGLYRFIGYDYKRRYGRLNIGASTPSLSPGLESGPGLEGGPGAESGPGLDSGPGL